MSTLDLLGKWLLAPLVRQVPGAVGVVVALPLLDGLLAIEEDQLQRQLVLLEKNEPTIRSDQTWAWGARGEIFLLGFLQYSI